MHVERREFMFTAVSGLVGLTQATRNGAEEEMYGLIGKMKAIEGERDNLIAILIEGIAGMPGCLSYVVARDPGDPHGIWITEVWKDEASHQASLSMPSVKEAIAKGRPLIASFDQSIVTIPVGGHGLSGN